MGTNPCDIYTYEATTQTWKYDYTSGYSTTCLANPVSFSASDILSSPDGTADGLMDQGRGYFVPGAGAGNSNKTFSSSSNPNEGTINVPIYGSSVALAGGNDWNGQ